MNMSALNSLGMLCVRDNFGSFRQCLFGCQNGEWTSFLISKRANQSVCHFRLWRQQLSPGLALSVEIKGTFMAFTSRKESYNDPEGL